MKKKKISYVILAIFLASMIGSPSVIAIEETFRFHFTQYATGTAWETYPQDMVDGDEDDYASTTDDRDVQYLTTGMSFGDEGDISKVELRVKGYWENADADIVLQPVFGGLDEGDLHVFNAPKELANASWSEWFDITDDTNSHTYWTWDDIEDLCCNVKVGDHSNGFTLYCSIVQIQVTYEPN
jgi:hypothetical protein